MNDGIVQSTLRELKGIAASRNLWLTFCSVVLLFAVTGPFGTMDSLRFLPRLLYWFVVHAATWSTALVFVVLGDVLLAKVVASMFWRMMTGSILSAIPIGAITQLIQLAWFGRVPDPASLASDIAGALPLCIIFCVISFLSMSANGLPGASGKAEGGSGATPEATSEVPAPLPTLEPVPLLLRLKPENRGKLQHLEVEDHYTLVRTTRGRELILLRFTDALRETGSTRGMQVHRSHWVADDFVTGLNRTNGKLTLRLADGTEIPVSRTYASRVRDRFG